MNVNKNNQNTCKMYWVVYTDGNNIKQKRQDNIKNENDRKNKVCEYDAKKKSQIKNFTVSSTIFAHKPTNIFGIIYFKTSIKKNILKHTYHTYHIKIHGR